MAIVLAVSNWEIVDNPVVMVLLLTIGLSGVFIELLAPGLIIPGVIGVLSFITYFYGQDMSVTESIAPLIFLVGLVLLVIEMFVLGGIFGTLGTIALFYAVVDAAKSLPLGITALAISIIVTAIFLWLLYRFFGFRSRWSRIILAEKQQNETGYTSSKDRKYLLGKKGIALSPLRPAGWAKIEGKKEDVVTEGEMIEKGSNVVVIHVEGTRVIVKKEDEVE